MKTAAFFMTFCLVIVMASLPFLTKKINGDNISISVSESEDWYKLTADYPEEKTRKVQRCLDEYLEPSGMSFVNARIDGDIALDNKARFYMLLSSLKDNKEITFFFKVAGVSAMPMVQPK